MTNPLGEYGLDNIDCDKCNNTGQIVWIDDSGLLRARDCECMAKRRSIRRIRKSGMENMLDRYTFGNYEEADRYRALIKRRAQEYVEDDGRYWFYIYGQSGSGKTHICTAICNAFIESGIEVYYMNWRDESVALKANVTDSEAYSERMNKLKSVSVLYIDDFFKAGCSSADIKLAFEILNSRYNKRLRTVISSEIVLDALFEIDEAIAGRIYEMSAKPRFLIKAPTENWRRRNVEQKVVVE